MQERPHNLEGHSFLHVYISYILWIAYRHARNDSGVYAGSYNVIVKGAAIVIVGLGSPALQYEKVGTSIHQHTEVISGHGELKISAVDALKKERDRISV